MLRLVWLATLSAVLIACAGHVRFFVEERFRFTLRHTNELNAGDALFIRLEGLGPNDEFYVNRCGRPCSTSKVVANRNGADGQTQEFSITLEESGEYYFWILRTFANGEAGPMRIESVKSRGPSFIARFATGVTAEGVLRPAL